MLKLAVIILNYKTPELVEACLKSLESQVDGSTIKVLVVDNGSPDNSQELIANFIKKNNWHSWCQLICSPANRGFAAGNNLGINSIEADSYLLLNSDTIVEANAIRELLKLLDTQTELGIISAHLEGPNGERHTTRFRFHSPISEFISNANIGIISKLLRNWEVPIFDQDPTPAQWVCFAAVLIRKSVFEKIGLLDEKYFMYYEDVDFCRRAAKESIQIGVCEGAKVIHLISASTQIYSSGENKLKRRPAYFYKSRNRYFKKYYGGAIGYLLANFFWILGRLLSIIVQPLRPNKKQTRYEKDYFDIWYYY